MSIPIPISGGDGGEVSPAGKKLGVDIPFRFEKKNDPNPVFFRYLGYFRCRLATFRSI